MHDGTGRVFGSIETYAFHNTFNVRDLFRTSGIQAMSKFLHIFSNE